MGRLVTGAALGTSSAAADTPGQTLLLGLGVLLPTVVAQLMFAQLADAWERTAGQRLEG